METAVMEHILSKLTLIHDDLKQLLLICQSRDTIDLSNGVESLKRELKISLNIIEDKETKQTVTNDIHTVRNYIDSLWKTKLNDRKSNFWNFLRFQNTAVIYETWLGQELPVMPKKFQVKTIKGEHADDVQLRKENAIRNFEVEIMLLKNKSKRCEEQFYSVDREMEEIINAN